MNPEPGHNTDIEQLIASERLPAEFIATVDEVYRPLARDLAQRANAHPSTLIVGVNGAQGTGKSTLTRFLCALLQSEFDLKAAAFSLDDIYLTKQQRLDLAQRIHPMLAVRGVPGTHDIALGTEVIDDLLSADADAVTLIPSFDKAIDDRAPRNTWLSMVGKPSVLIVEGWCAGALPEAEAALGDPLNTLEATEDPNGVWRHYVNQQLKTEYHQFFSRFDVLVFIPVPRWELVYKWRLLQEEKLKAKCVASGLDVSAIMSPEQIERFVQYYERVTRHTLDEMAARADYVVRMDENHRITDVLGLV